MNPYDLIAQYPDAGQAFAGAFDKGQQQNALTSFVLNPNDPNAQAAAARFAPQEVMQQREQQRELSQQQVQHWHQYAGELAKWADTPEKWDQAINYLLQSNHPDVSTEQLMQLKGHFDPALRQSFMALGGVQDDKPQQPEAGIQEYQFYSAQQAAQGKQPMPFDQFVQMLHPAISSPVSIPYGATVSNPGAPAGAAPLTATGPNGQKIRLNPQTNQWEPMGGAGGNASGGFPQ